VHVSKREPKLGGGQAFGASSPPSPALVGAVTQQGECSRYIHVSTNYTACSASSTRNNDKIGEGSGRGGLFSLGGWEAATGDTDLWWKIDLGMVKSIAGVATQGHHIEKPLKAYVTSYQVQVSMDDRKWTKVNSSARDGNFIGNVKHCEGDTVRVNNFSKPISARYVRVLPKDFEERISMRIGVMVCRDGKGYKAWEGVDVITDLKGAKTNHGKPITHAYQFFDTNQKNWFNKAADLAFLLGTEEHIEAAVKKNGGKFKTENDCYEAIKGRLKLYGTCGKMTAKLYPEGKTTGCAHLKMMHGSHDWSVAKILVPNKNTRRRRRWSQPKPVEKAWPWWDVDAPCAGTVNTQEISVQHDNSCYMPDTLDQTFLAGKARYLQDWAKGVGNTARWTVRTSTVDNKPYIYFTIDLVGKTPEGTECHSEHYVRMATCQDCCCKALVRYEVGSTDFGDESVHAENTKCTNWFSKASVIANSFFNMWRTEATNAYMKQVHSKCASEKNTCGNKD